MAMDDGHVPASTLSDSTVVTLSTPTPPVDRAVVHDAQREILEEIPAFRPCRSQSSVGGGSCTVSVPPTNTWTGDPPASKRGKCMQVCVFPRPLGVTWEPMWGNLLEARTLTCLIDC